VVQLVVSVSLLLFASTRKDLQAWGGPLDGIVAFTLVGTAFFIWRRAGDRAGLGEFRTSHAAAAIVPALVLAAIWWYRDALDFNILLPGLAWRTWLVVYTLPFAITLLRARLGQRG
jgi:hypothetical protein